VHGLEFEMEVDNPNKQFKLTIPKKGQVVKPKEIKCSEEYKKPPLRYSEAGLVKKMDPKNLNIGRPATYAEIINTIQKRNYVEIKDVDGCEKKSRILSWYPKYLKSPNAPKSPNADDIAVEEKTIHIGREKNKFCPTNLGIEVNVTMNKHFPDIMEYQFTANMEKELDEIAEGDEDWVKCLDRFWKKLKPLVENLDTEKKVQRIVGKHPETGYEIIASIGYHGPILTMARSEKKTENAIVPIKPPYTIENITLKQAIAVLKYPKILGTHEKKFVELKTGKHGYYITFGTASVNIPDDINPDDITLETAIEYLNTKQKQYEERMKAYLYYHKENNLEYIINKGKYGEDNKYLMIKDTAAKKKAKPLFLPFPSDENLKDITFDRVKELVDTARTQKRARRSALKGGTPKGSAKSGTKSGTKGSAKRGTPKGSAKGSKAKTSGRAKAS
jgi:DNA topoisomerase-1